MGNGMNRVLPGLYVGNYRDSKDASQLERHKITHIIAIHDAARRIHTDKEYLCIMASDSPYQNLSQYFPTCNDFIHSARIQGGNVLIHCLAGMSRSVTIAVAYIMSITSLRWNEALKVVRGARAVSNPNSGFQKQLQDFESTKLPEERRRLLEKFPGTTYFENDEEQCKKLLAAYNNLLLSRAICEGRCTSAKVCPTGTCRAHASPRLGRHKSTDSSMGTPGSSSSASPFSRGGSTKSLDSVTSPQDPGSPKNWERHYGCWKNHFRHRQGTSSTPSTPILYRAAKRTDSVTSIASMSSVTSLPGQIAINDDVKDPSGPTTSGPGGISASILERNPFLVTQSCPNSPRRTPKKIPPSRAEVSKLVRISSISSVSSTEKLNTTNTTTAVSTVASSSSSSTVKTTSSARGPVTTTTTSGSRTRADKTPSSGGTNVKFATCATVCSRARPSSASAVLSRTTSSSLANKPSTPAIASGSTTTTTTSETAATAIASTSSNTSSPSASPWGTPPSSPANRSLAMRKGSSGSKNVTVTASGATRWVMKRSAYRFSLDNS